jgi:hypothetical protein
MIKDEKLYKLAISTRNQMYDFHLDTEENRAIYFKVNELLEYILK